MSEAPTRPLTEGEYRVGISFNPSSNPQVDSIKRKAADLIDEIAVIVQDYVRPADARRCADIAVFQIEDGAMWAVKALTKPPRA